MQYRHRKKVYHQHRTCQLQEILHSGKNAGTQKRISFWDVTKLQLRLPEDKLLQLRKELSSQQLYMESDGQGKQLKHGCCGCGELSILQR